MGSRVELFADIRRDARVEGCSIRELADRYHVHRRTVRQALASAVPPPRKIPARTSPRLAPFMVAIDGMLRADLDAPKKQRHTARRVLARLVDEHGAAELSYSTVRDYVARRRPQIAAEAGKPLETGCVPQTHPPAAEAEVDFHDLWVILAGVKTKTALFTMRLSYSGRAVHRVSLSQGQEAFLEAHVHAFGRLGGVPLEQIRYDNLKPAVSRVLFGRSRVESDRWIAFRSHYGFDAFYCQPGHEGSHEKGGVEGEGGRFRRNHCVPMPAVASIDELNALLEAWDDADDRRRIGNRSSSVGNDWAFERRLLRPLPAEPFDTALTLTPRVDRYSQVMVRCNQYSVPARFIGHRVRVKLSASAVTVYDRNAMVARHQRAAGKGVKVLDLDHYLEILARKPGALPGATALVQARAAGTFTPAHEAFWAAARKALGDGPGTRALIEVLLLHRHLGHGDVHAGLSAALAVGSVSPDVVAVEARKAAQQRGIQLPPAPASRASNQVISLTQRRQTALPADDRPVPSVAVYDDLLGKASS
ncbi:MAG TPA: IS21 family transposase [Streptosporangiaceae bacterium]|nr:IS21 family transposase [Streptosporangiaceae bacterium]